MSKKEQTSRLAGRDAKTGEFIKVQEAKRRPATTVVERLPLPGHGDSDRKPKKK
jgi:hypothetical protein